MPALGTPTEIQHYCVDRDPEPCRGTFLLRSFTAKRSGHRALCLLISTASIFIRQCRHRALTAVPLLKYSNSVSSGATAAPILPLLARGLFRGGTHHRPFPPCQAFQGLPDLPQLPAFGTPTTDRGDGRAARAASLSERTTISTKSNLS